MSDFRAVDNSDQAGVAQVDEYLARAPEPQRSTCQALRQTLRELLPTATEAMSYGMPAFLIDGRPVAGYAAGKTFCSYYPHSGSVLTELATELAGFEQTKGALHFPIDKPLAKTLVRKLVKAKLDLSSDVFNGKRRDYYDNGILKAEGSMRQGELHGAWKWYRRDGSIMREGEFINGTQVGRWRTFDESGNLVKETVIKR